MNEKTQKRLDIGFLLSIIFHLEDAGYSLDDIYIMFESYKFREKYYKDRDTYRAMKISDIAIEIITNH